MLSVDFYFCSEKPTQRGLWGTGILYWAPGVMKRRPPQLTLNPLTGKGGGGWPPQLPKGNSCNWHKGANKKANFRTSPNPCVCEEISAQCRHQLTHQLDFHNPKGTCSSWCSHSLSHLFWFIPLIFLSSYLFFTAVASLLDTDKSSLLKYYINMVHSAFPIFPFICMN